MFHWIISGAYSCRFVFKLCCTTLCVVLMIRELTWSQAQCPCLEEVNIKIWPSLSHGAFLFPFCFLNCQFSEPNGKQENYSIWLCISPKWYFCVCGWGSLSGTKSWVSIINKTIFQICTGAPLLFRFTQKLHTCTVWNFMYIGREVSAHEHICALYLGGWIEHRDVLHLILGEILVRS